MGHGGPHSRAHLAVLLALTALVGLSDARASAGLFAPTSVWNTALAADAPLDPNSPSLVTALVAQARRAPRVLATTTFSTPVYRVAADTPLVPVQMAAFNPVLRSQMAQVPIPANVRPSQDSDGRLVIWQRSTDTLWEFWRMRHVGSAWSATYGGRIDGVSESPGVFPAPFGSTASGLPLLGGLILPSELRSGHIDHVLAMGVPNTAARAFVAPATRTDGKTAAGGIPMGTRFRLDPRLNISALHLPRATAIIARAAQRYGMIVRDTSGGVAFYGEEVRGRPSPWPLLFRGLTSSQLLRRFPYGRLQVVAP